MTTLASTLQQDSIPASARKASQAMLMSSDWRTAMTLTKAGQWESALGAIQKVAKKYPRDPWLMLNMARTYVELGDHERGIEWARKSLKVCPEDKLTQDLLLQSLCAMRQFKEAAELVEEVFEGSDQTLEVLSDLAYQQIVMGERGEGIRTVMKTLAMKIDHARSHFLMGVGFMASNQNIEALECFETAVLLGAGRDQLASQAHRAYLSRQEIRWDIADEALNAFTEHVRNMSDQERVWSAVFSSATLLSDPVLQLKAARSTSQQLSMHIKPLPYQAPLPGLAEGLRPMRVGFLSSDLHHHATAFLMMELFEELPKNGVELYLYSHGVDDKSEERARLKASTEHFKDVAGDSDIEIAKLIQSDHIDILIDLKGHTSGSRLQIFAYRPAPIQMTFLGHPGTTGASYIDYFIGDAIVTPLEHQQYYSEKLVHMPVCYQPNDRHRPLPKPMTRAEVGLPENALVLCGFNQPYKISPEVFGVWCWLLEEIPSSVLWLLDWFDGTVDKFKAKAESMGISPDRIISAPREKLDKHLSRFALADIYLDSWPCNGHTTVSDAVWSGVPVITMMQETFASRVAASLLNAVGLQENICTSYESYAHRVLELANDQDLRQKLRQKLELSRYNAKLFDSATFAQDFKNLLYHLLVKK